MHPAFRHKLSAQVQQTGSHTLFLCFTCFPFPLFWAVLHRDLFGDQLPSVRHDFNLGTPWAPWNNANRCLKFWKESTSGNRLITLRRFSLTQKILANIFYYTILDFSFSQNIVQKSNFQSYQFYLFFPDVIHVRCKMKTLSLQHVFVYSFSQNCQTS